MLTVYAYNALLISLCHFGLAIFVLIRNARRNFNLSFLVMCLSISAWSFGIYQHTLASHIAQAEHWDLFLHLSSIFIAWAFVHFTSGFTKRKRTRWITVIDLMNTLILLSFLYEPKWFMLEITDKPHFNFFPTAQLGYYFYTLAFFISFSYACYVLIRSYIQATSILLKEQIKYFFVGMVVGVAGGSTNFLAVFFKGVYPIGCYAITFFAFMVAYAIVKHYLMDIDVFIKRSLVYVGLLLILLIPSYLLLLYFENIFLSKVYLSFSLAALCVFLAFAYSFYKLNQIVEPQLVQLTAKKGYNYQQIIQRINYGINHFSDLNELLGYWARIIVEAINLENVSLYVQKKENSFELAASGVPKGELKKEYHPSQTFQRILQLKDSILIREEFLSRQASQKNKVILEEIEHLNAELILPVFYEDILEGFLVIGKKRGKNLFSKHDIDLLRVFALHIGSILNIESYKVIEALNVNLQEKTKSLEEAMVALKSAQSQLIHSAKLASVGELAAGVAHEINNALNVAILGNIHLKDLLENQKVPTEHIVQEAKEDIEILSNGMNRAQAVVKNLLTFSKKNSEGFREQHLHEGILSSLQILHNEFKNRIKVHTDFCEDDRVFCDLSQLNQVFLNILKNAADMMAEKGNLWIRTWREKETFCLSVQDDGPGIPAENLTKIFDPFFTTKEVGKGTGLGLSVSYNVIQNHHGTIECMSQPGQGAEFIIKLPICAKGKRDDHKQAV